MLKRVMMWWFKKSRRKWSIWQTMKKRSSILKGLFQGF